MMHSNVKELALQNIALLEKVVSFKKKFYPRNWADYDAAKSGTLKLCVPEYRLEALEKDYAQMQEMLYGNIPDFTTVMMALKELEDEINHVNNK